MNNIDKLNVLKSDVLEHMEKSSNIELNINKSDVFKKIEGESFNFLNGFDTQKIFFSNVKNDEVSIKIINNDGIAYSSYNLDLSKNIDDKIIIDIFQELITIIDEENLNNSNDFINEFKEEVEKKYFVKSWFDSYDRDKGISNIEDSFSNLDDAISLAKSLVKKQDFASAEVVDKDENIIYHISYDVIDEEYIIEDNRESLNSIER